MTTIDDYGRRLFTTVHSRRWRVRMNRVPVLRGQNAHNLEAQCRHFLRHFHAEVATVKYDDGTGGLATTGSLMGAKHFTKQRDGLLCASRTSALHSAHSIMGMKAPR